MTVQNTRCKWDLTVKVHRTGKNTVRPGAGDIVQRSDWQVANSLLTIHKERLHLLYFSLCVQATACMNSFSK